MYVSNTYQWSHPASPPTYRHHKKPLVEPSVCYGNTLVSPTHTWHHRSLVILTWMEDTPYAVCKARPMRNEVSLASVRTARGSELCTEQANRGFISLDQDLEQPWSGRGLRLYPDNISTYWQDDITWQDIGTRDISETRMYKNTDFLPRLCPVPVLTLCLWSCQCQYFPVWAYNVT